MVAAGYLPGFALLGKHLSTGLSISLLVLSTLLTQHLSMDQYLDVPSKT